MTQNPLLYVTLFWMWTAFEPYIQEAVEYTDAQIYVPGRPWRSRGVHLTCTMHVIVTVPNVLVLQKHFGTPCDVIM
jgi:hypothetical protein